MAEKRAFTIVEHYNGRVGYAIQASSVEEAIQMLKDGAHGNLDAYFDEVDSVERIELYERLGKKPIYTDCLDPELTATLGDDIYTKD